jgi:hypothetical protein
MSPTSRGTTPRRPGPGHGNPEQQHRPNGEGDLPGRPQQRQPGTGGQPGGQCQRGHHRVRATGRWHRRRSTAVAGCSHMANSRRRITHNGDTQNGRRGMNG